MVISYQLRVTSYEKETLGFAKTLLTGYWLLATGY